MTRRGAWARLHRYAGLATALFLATAGLSGAVIAWHEEIDVALNADVLRARTAANAPVEYAIEDWIARVEATWPHSQVFYVAAPRDVQHVAQLYLAPREGQVEPEVDQVFLEPATQRITGARRRGVVPTRRLEVVPFVYALHESLCAGELGRRFLGCVAIVWFFDTIVGLRLAWPRLTLRSIRRAFGARLRGHPARRNYELHRASGLWVWPMLSVMAFTGFAMALHAEVFEPILDKLGPLTPDVLETLPTGDGHFTISPSAAMDLAKARVAERFGETVRVGGLRIVHDKHAYVVGLHTPADLMEAYPGAWVTVAGDRPVVLETRFAGGTTSTDWVHDLQLPLHSGRVMGTGGRVLITMLGLVVSVLSVTGVLVWWRKVGLRSR